MKDKAKTKYLRQLFEANIVGINGRIHRIDYKSEFLVSDGNIVKGECCYCPRTNKFYGFKSLRRKNVKGNKTNYKNRNKIQRIKNNRGNNRGLEIRDIFKG